MTAALALLQDILEIDIEKDPFENRRFKEKSIT